MTTHLERLLNCLREKRKATGQQPLTDAKLAEFADEATTLPVMIAWTDALEAVAKRNVTIRTLIGEVDWYRSQLAETRDQ